MIFLRTLIVAFIVTGILDLLATINEQVRDFA